MLQLHQSSTIKWFMMECHISEALAVVGTVLSWYWDGTGAGGWHR